jgi:hypothetical protein
VIRAVVSAHVNASADFVRSLYEDPDNWAKLCPATIRGANAVRRDQHRTVVEVSHIDGKVVNILQFMRRIAIPRSPAKAACRALETTSDDGFTHDLSRPGLPLHSPQPSAGQCNALVPERASCR